MGFDVLETKCKTCEIAKSYQQPFNKQTSCAQLALQRIYSDIVRPLSPEALGSYDGVKYILTFIDDFSHFIFVYFLTQKNEVFVTFKRFKTFIEMKIKCKIKTLHWDRGGEFISLEMKAFLEEEGIIHKKTAPYTLQSNRVAERFNHTLLESK